jgi:2-dehydro-3-deoxyphosphogluconate aldolase/(4S)-4-hydroxy-2-oxoglutarate aldolase
MTTPEDVLAQITRFGVMPVIVAQHTSDADVLGEGLVSGGLPVAEVTLRTPAAGSVLDALAQRGDILVGAGTVTTAEQVDVAADLGATFIVSPGIDPDIVERCQKLGVLPLPGVATASELQLAVRLGLATVKLFPAALLGGPSAIDALSAPFPGMRFLPSGGIRLSDVADYLARPSVAAVCGSWMVGPAVIASGPVDIAAAVAETVAIAGEARGR